MNEDAGWWLLIVALCLLVVALIADCSGGSSQQHLAVIVGRAYRPSETHVSVGVDSDGNPVTSVSTTPEHWRVVVRDEFGVRSVDTSAALWAVARDDMVIAVGWRVGRWTGMRYGEHFTGWPRPATAEAP